MKDVELIALTEFVATERFCMEADNELRSIQGSSPAYGGDISWEAKDKLGTELKRRGILER